MTSENMNKTRNKQGTRVEYKRCIEYLRNKYRSDQTLSGSQNGKYYSHLILRFTYEDFYHCYWTYRVNLFEFFNAGIGITDLSKLIWCPGSFNQDGMPIPCLEAKPDKERMDLMRHYICHEHEYRNALEWICECGRGFNKNKYEKCPFCNGLDVSPDYGICDDKKCLSCIERLKLTSQRPGPHPS